MGYYGKIECPVCGNDIQAQYTRGVQKCKWCRRLFVVNVVRKGQKTFWEAEEVQKENQPF